MAQAVCVVCYLIDHFNQSFESMLGSCLCQVLQGQILVQRVVVLDVEAHIKTICRKEAKWPCHIFLTHIYVSHERKKNHFLYIFLQRKPFLCLHLSVLKYKAPVLYLMYSNFRKHVLMPM